MQITANMQGRTGVVEIEAAYLQPLFESRYANLETQVHWQRWI